VWVRQQHVDESSGSIALRIDASARQPLRYAMRSFSQRRFEITHVYGSIAQSWAPACTPSVTPRSLAKIWRDRFAQLRDKATRTLTELLTGGPTLRCRGHVVSTS